MQSKAVLFISAFALSFIIITSAQEVTNFPDSQQLNDADTGVALADSKKHSSKKRQCITWARYHGCRNGKKRAFSPRMVS